MRKLESVCIETVTMHFDSMQQIMGFLEERDLSDVPTIREFFRGKNIFITGGSGYMGKVLIEKLLYSCTDLNKIYLLLRSKRGVSPEERIQKIYSVPCFDRLRKDRPGVFQSKVAIVPGDASQVGLGLSLEDRNLIINKVNIIFHVAASVRFDDPLAVSAKINLRSTVDLLDIAQKMKNLNVFVHVSTAYSNTQWNPIEERMYPSYVDWRDTLNICENIDEKTLKILTPKYIGEVANTYVFTKQLAEHAVYEQKGKLPIVIIRPAIVVASLKEPVVGWMENFNGPISLLIGAGKGVLRCLYSREDFAANFVPVDGCINHFISAAWIRGTKKLEPTDDVEIYNCCSEEKISNRMFIEFGKYISSEIPLESPLWTINCTFHSSKIMYYINVLYKHLIPALLVDMVLRINGKKPVLMTLQRKIFVNNLAVQTFLIFEWDFYTENFNKLRSCLKKEDVDDFYYTFKMDCVMQYLKNSTIAAKTYLLKEKMENLPKTKAYIKRINIVDKLLHYATYGAVVWVFINSNFVFNLYQKIIM